MNDSLPQLDGSPELGALVLGLYRRFGAAPFSEGETMAAALPLARPSSDEVELEDFLRDYVTALLRGGYLVRAAGSDDGSLALGPRAKEFAAEHDRLLEQEIERFAENLDALFVETTDEPQPIPPPLPDADLHQVTRTFLEDALDEAAVPSKLMETIVATYESEGRLTMSEDGCYYRVCLAAR